MTRDLFSHLNIVLCLASGKNILETGCTRHKLAGWASYSDDHHHVELICFQSLQTARDYTAGDREKRKLMDALHSPHGRTRYSRLHYTKQSLQDITLLDQVRGNKSVS